MDRVTGPLALTPEQLEAAALILAEPVRDRRYVETRLGPSVEDYLAWKDVEDGAAPRTIDSYERVLARMCVLLADHDLAGVTTDDLRCVRDAFTAGQRRKVTAVLRDFWRWLYEEERIDVNPMGRVRYPRRTKEIKIRVFTDTEYEALVAQPEVRDATLMLILLETGIRKGEARMLQVLHVNVEEAYATIVRSKGARGRIVPLSERVVRAVSELVLLDGLDPSEYLWYGTLGNRTGRTGITRDRPCGEGTFHRWWQASLSRVGVKYRKPHTARHTFATRWLPRWRQHRRLVAHPRARLDRHHGRPVRAPCDPRPRRRAAAPTGFAGKQSAQHVAKTLLRAAISVVRGADRNRTGVRGFAGLCLATRPRRREGKS